MEQLLEKTKENRTAPAGKLEEKDVMRAVEQNRGSVVEMMLLLLWKAGISPKEMQPLTWADIDFDAEEIILPNRRVPMEPEVLQCLRARHERYLLARIWPEFLIITDGRRSHMHQVSIYRLLRHALDAAGMEDIQPADLQEDYIIRLLQTHDWPYVVRVSGIAIRTLYTNYSEYLPSRLKSQTAEVDETRLTSLLLKEGPTPAGLALWMTWQMGMNLREIAALTWQQVDLSSACILLPDRIVPMDDTLEEWLEKLVAAAPEEKDHVLLTPRSGQPFDPARLSVVARQALIHGGMEELSTEALMRHGGSRKRSGQTERILRLAEERRFLSRADVMELLGVTKNVAYHLLRILVEQEELILVGAKYYRRGLVEPPEEHYPLIRDYLEREGGAYRKELADLLRIDTRSCGWILHNLTKEGLLRHERQRYYLPEEKTPHETGKAAKK